MAEVALTLSGRCGCTGWFLAFVSTIVLPSPIVYFYYKDTHSVTGTRWTNASSSTAAEGSDDNPIRMENPLSFGESDQADVYDIEGSELANVPPSRIKLAKLQREAKDSRAQVQQLQTQNRQLQAETAAKDNDIAAVKAENVSLKVLTTATDESTKVQALQAEIATAKAETAALKDQLARRPQADGMQLAMFSDEAQSTATIQQQPTEQSSEAVMKEHAIDETLSEETRESAKQALDELAAARIKDLAFERHLSLKNLAFERRLALVQADRKLRGVAIVSDAVSEDMTTYLRGHRLLHYANAVIRVVGV
jgi:myosin heavy subunit